MKRATVTISGDLENALSRYYSQQEVEPSFTALVQAALREYLNRRGFAPPARPLRVTPARKRSGRGDISLRHDDYLAEKA